VLVNKKHPKSMNADLTLNSLSFKQVSNSETGSIRRESSRGVNLPEVLTIRHQSYTDNGTKVPGVRTNVRFERFVAITSGQIVPVVASLTVAVPLDTAILSADVTAVIDRMVNLLHGTTNTSGLELRDEILVNKEQ
jgi:hypothetical protein